MNGIENLVGKWESEYNNKVNQLDAIREFVSGEYLRKQESILEQKSQMIEELKSTLYETSGN